MTPLLMAVAMMSEPSLPADTEPTWIGLAESSTARPSFCQSPSARRQRVAAMLAGLRDCMEASITRLLCASTVRKHDLPRPQYSPSSLVFNDESTSHFSPSLLLKR